MKGVGQGAMDALVKVREEGGAFRDLFDFTARLDAQLLNKRQLENLTAAGAFDSLNPNRHQTFAAIETILRHAQSAASERDSQQVSLFGDLEPGRRPPLRPAGGARTGRRSHKLAKEFEAIGFYLSAHPLDAYGASLKRLGVIRYGDIPAWLATRPPSTRAEARRRRGEPAGAHLRARQPLRLRPALRPERHLRDHRVRRPARHRPRPAGAEAETVLLSADVRSEEDSLRLTGPAGADRSTRPSPTPPPACASS